MHYLRGSVFGVTFATCMFIASVVACSESYVFGLGQDGAQTLDDTIYKESQNGKHTTKSETGQVQTLIGRWRLIGEVKDASKWVDYLPDGATIVLPSGRTMKYRVIDKTTMEVTDAQGHDTTYRFIVSNNQFTLTPISGKYSGKPTLTYKRD